MDEAGLARALPGTLARLTPATITDRSVLAAELAMIRGRGYALDREEHTEGICGAGVFLGLVADVPTAVSIPMPAQRFYGREHVIAKVLSDWAGRGSPCTDSHPGGCACQNPQATRPIRNG